MSDPEKPLITVVGPDGQATDVSPEDLPKWTARGFREEGGEERAHRIGTATRTEAEGVAAPVALGILRGGTFGLSDVVARGLGGEDARIQLEQNAEDHPYATMGGEVLGALATGHATAGRLGGAAARGFGEGIAGGVARGVAEGTAYGAGGAVSQLAMSQDPLDADHIVSALSSNMLLGGGLGGLAGGAFKAIERGLARAGSAIAEATGTRAAIEGIPADLSGLDEAGLKTAGKAAAEERAADIAAERKSLEALRVDQRAELANQVKELHADLATERPIFQAVAGEDVAKIAGVSDIKVQLAKSYGSLRSAFDSPLSVERDPMSLIRPLEQRQAALEALQGKTPELQAALAGDARAQVLEHVDDALEQTKKQIDQIRSLSSKKPVASGRLTALEAGPTERQQAIDAAREALKKAPEIGMLGKGAKAGAFAGVTAVAHAIPGVGLAAPFLGKAASDLVGGLFERLAGGVKAVTSKSAGAVKTFLDAAEKVEPIARMTATKTLASVRFGAGPEPKSGELADLFHARSSELRAQTMYAPDGSVQMRPEARQAVAQRLAPIAAVNPLLADKIETGIARRTAFVSSKIPRHPEVGGIQIGPDNWKPSELQMRSWARTIRAAEDPAGVESRLAHGTVTPEDAEAYRACYPERFAALQRDIFAAVPKLAKTLPLARKVALFVFTGVPTTPALQPNILKVLQGNFATEAGSAGGTAAPKPMPSFGALGSMKSLDKPTPAQDRG